jgi:predicted transcriptional regulator
LSYQEIEMGDEGRVVTAKLPTELATRLDDAAERIDRTRSWIIRHAVAEWLAEEQRRHELTLEAMAEVDAGQTLTHAEVLARVEQRKRERREQRAKT